MKRGRLRRAVGLDRDEWHDLEQLAGELGQDPRDLIAGTLRRVVAGSLDDRVGVPAVGVYVPATNFLSWRYAPERLRAHRLAGLDATPLTAETWPG